jgi:hypothetical protein
MNVKILPDYTESFEKSLNWLLRSIEINQGQGSSAYFHIVRGWSSPYPETTGYIIPTLWQVHDILPDRHIDKIAIGLTDWLIKIQKKDGSFPQGLELGEMPEVFDGGQILFGLYTTWIKTSEVKYKSRIIELAQWILDQQCESGAFNKNTYISGYSPSYHIRIVWALLLVKDVYPDSNFLLQKAQNGLQYYAGLLTEDGSFTNWGLRPDANGLTHTIAYTLRGFFECALLLKDTHWIDTVMKATQSLIIEMENKPYLAGDYDLNWNGDYSYRCLTGEAQLSIFLRRLYTYTNCEAYNIFADQLLNQISSKQINTLFFRDLHGGFFASAPFYGKYMRFMMNNWTVKFYLDAIMIKSNPDMVLWG